MALETQKVLVISTGNLSPATRADIGAAAPGPCIAWEYGWWIWVAPREDRCDGIETPADLQAALDLGLANSCEWVRFDADADAAEGLERWED